VAFFGAFFRIIAVVSPVPVRFRFNFRSFAFSDGTTAVYVSSVRPRRWRGGGCTPRRSGRVSSRQNAKPGITRNALISIPKTTTTTKRSKHTRTFRYAFRLFGFSLRLLRAHIYLVCVYLVVIRFDFEYGYFIRIFCRYYYFCLSSNGFVFIKLRDGHANII